MDIDCFTSWEKWTEAIINLEGQWLYKGQTSDSILETSLEKECLKSGFSLDYAENIEKMMIRQFKRVYTGDDREIVKNDTLYCISLLRHFGAPVRLLDFSCSK